MEIWWTVGGGRWTNLERIFDYRRALLDDIIEVRVFLHKNLFGVSNSAADVDDKRAFR
jgi:hypothetical protein